MTRIQFGLGYALSFAMVAGALVLAGVHSAPKHEIEIKVKDPSADNHKDFAGSPMPLLKSADSPSAAQ